jgi:UDP-MurNAc hydroxylase
MRVQYLKSACVLVSSNEVKILFDPWLTDGEYYGSWFHYPPFDFKPQEYDDVDFIYISHIHPDHFSKNTLSALKKSIPVLIHSYHSKFLKANIERLGFQVVELKHNVKTHLKNDVYINILAADDCNPELCMKFFGCGVFKANNGSSQIDSLCVVSDSKYTLVNINDCPIQLAEAAAKKILLEYSKIDFLLVGFAGAGPYPQCIKNLDVRKDSSFAEGKKKQFLKQGLDFIKLFNPDYFLPFAGTYTLGGPLAELNNYRGVPDADEAMVFYNQQSSCIGLVLNSKSYFDLDTRKSSEVYRPIDKNERRKYIKEVLGPKKYTYEVIGIPSLNKLEELIQKAYVRMETVRVSIQFVSDTSVVIPLIDGKAIQVSLKGGGWQLIDEAISYQFNFVQYKVNPKLLFLILQGPQFAHWNNAEIGSHIEFYRKPEKFERGLHHCMSFFHQ